MTVGGVVQACLHAQCPHIAKCLGAGKCTEPVMVPPQQQTYFTETTQHPDVKTSVTTDLPAFLPLRKGFGGE
jgi:hypothetical protein